MATRRPAYDVNTDTFNPDFLQNILGGAREAMGGPVDRAGIGQVQTGGAPGTGFEEQGRGTQMPRERTASEPTSLIPPSSIIERAEAMAMPALPSLTGAPVAPQLAQVPETPQLAPMPTTPREPAPASMAPPPSSPMTPASTPSAGTPLSAIPATVARAPMPFARTPAVLGERRGGLLGRGGGQFGGGLGVPGQAAEGSPQGVFNRLFRILTALSGAAVMLGGLWPR